MSKIKLCEECAAKFKRAGKKGGAAGSHEAKVKAGANGGASKSAVKVKAGRNNLAKARRIRAEKLHGASEAKVL